MYLSVFTTLAADGVEKSLPAMMLGSTLGSTPRAVKLACHCSNCEKRVRIVWGVLLSSLQPPQGAINI